MSLALLVSNVALAWCVVAASLFVLALSIGEGER